MLLSMLRRTVEAWQPDADRPLLWPSSGRACRHRRWRLRRITPGPVLPSGANCPDSCDTPLQLATGRNDSLDTIACQTRAGADCKARTGERRRPAGPGSGQRGVSRARAPSEPCRGLRPGHRPRRLTNVPASGGGGRHRVPPPATATRPRSPAAGWHLGAAAAAGNDADRRGTQRGGSFSPEALPRTSVGVDASDA